MGIQTMAHSKIHPTAIIHPTAELAPDVEIGPYSIVGPHVFIGEGTILESHVVVERWTTIGAYCHIFHSAILGGPPQDTKFKGERSYLRIGDRNVIREFVTIHRATGEEEATIIGNDNMIMGYVHIGHNCKLGNGIIIANQAGISGHVIVEDHVVFGGMVGVHQYTRIGKLAMLGGMSKVVQDVPPFMMVDGRPAEVLDLNIIGLRRHGIPPAVRAGLRQAYKLLYRSKLNMSQAIEAIEEEVEPSPERDYLLDFLRSIRKGFGGRANDPRGMR
jgi:UDP-N-acetylglucosamine acyltransferase